MLYFLCSYLQYSYALLFTYSRIDMYYEASRDFYYNFLPVLFMKTEEQAVKDAKAAGEDKYFPALEKVNLN